MRVVIQRVSSASVSIDGKIKSSIEKGLLILVGIEDTDNEENVVKGANKIPKMRIFNDEKELMNLSVQDVDGDILVVSQFTLHADVKKGNRPSYTKAARPEKAIPLYERFVKELALITNKQIYTGEFGADMKVQLLNDGPVTIFFDTNDM